MSYLKSLHGSSLALVLCFSSILAVNAEVCGDPASTCAPVDVHCHKRYINPHSLDNCGVRFCAKECELKKLTFGGLIQANFDYIRTDDRSTNGDVKDPFEALSFRPRVRFNTIADLGNCWYGLIEFDIVPEGKAQCVQEPGSSVPFVINDAEEIQPTPGNQIIPPAQAQQSPDSDDPNATRCFTPCGDPNPNESPEGINPDACNQSLSDALFTLQMAYIEKILEGNSIKIGYKKVNFGVEENTKIAAIPAIERSLATNYFTGFMGRLPCRPSAQCGDSRLGIGTRHVGVFLDGEYHGFGYGMAITNGFQGLGKSSKFANEIGLYGNLYYDTCLSGFNVKCGLNLAYQPEGNTNWMATQGKHIALANQGVPAVDTDHPVTPVRSSILAWNPYLNLRWKKWNLIAELLGVRVENGVINVSNQVSGNAKPLAYNVTSVYKWSEKWETVSRCAHLDTDQRGVRIANVVLGANNVMGKAPAPLTNIFDEATAYYFGLNYYLKNKAVKLAVGYEHIDFHGRWGNNQRIPSRVPGLLPSLAAGQGNVFSGDKAKLDVVRARVQVVF